MTYQKLAEWIIPVMLGLTVWTLQQISLEISKLNQSMAVAITKIENHEFRLGKLETVPQRRFK